MSLAKELLLSYIVMMHISFMASLEPCTLGNGESCRPEWKKMVAPLCNLLRAQNAYVEHIFNGETPMKKQLKTMKGITLPVRNNTKEIQASVCAISDYLSNHLPAIIRSLIQAPHNEQLINNTDNFHHNFIAAVRKTQHIKPCNRNVTTSDDYSKKVIGLRIIDSSRRWMEGFMHTHSSCN